MQSGPGGGKAERLYAGICFTVNKREFFRCKVMKNRNVQVTDETSNQT